MDDELSHDKKLIRNRSTQANRDWWDSVKRAADRVGAVDLRDYVEMLERSNDLLRSANAELEKALEAKGTRVGEKEMGQRLDELEKDRERLDWLDATDYEGEARLTLIERSWWTGLQSVRAAIDAAMSEDQRGEETEGGSDAEVS